MYANRVFMYAYEMAGAGPSIDLGPASVRVKEPGRANWQFNTPKITHL
jgi:hypothetical protein